MIQRVCLALPSRRELLFGAPSWSLVTTGNAVAALWLRGWRDMPLLDVGLLFAAGGLLAFPLGLWTGRFLAGSRKPETKFAAVFLCLAVATVAVTGGLYAGQYRHYYAQWHAPAFTVMWTFQLVFTGLVALYQFAVLGVRLLFPLGLAALFAVSFIVARPKR